MSRWCRAHLIEVLVAERLVERDRALLVGEFLRMHEGQVEEATQRRIDGLVVPPLDRTIRDHHGGGVGAVGAPRAAEHVTRELVQQQAQRERAVRRQLPFIEVVAGGGLMGEEEALAADRVESLVLGEPSVRTRLAPEGQHVLDRRGALGHGRGTCE